MNYKEAGLRESEYLSLKKTLGREPNELELRIMGVMWSEHCSYKSTRPLLKKLPKEGRFVVLGPGENAGVIDGGAGIGIAFKVESHNHPSAVAPYQGAATGVGGIIRALETNASMAWVIAVGVALVLAIVGVLFALGLPRFRRMQEQIDRVNLVMRETLTGLPVIRAFVTQ